MVQQRAASAKQTWRTADLWQSSPSSLQILNATVGPEGYIVKLLCYQSFHGISPPDRAVSEKFLPFFPMLRTAANVLKSHCMSHCGKSLIERNPPASRPSTSHPPGYQPCYKSVDTASLARLQVLQRFVVHPSFVNRLVLETPNILSKIGHAC